MAITETVYTLHQFSTGQELSLGDHANTLTETRELNVNDSVLSDPSVATADGSRTFLPTPKSSSSHPGSETSTVEYEQTPFEEFRSQVEELCHLLWAPPSSPKDVQYVSNSRILSVLRKKKLRRTLEPKPPSKKFLIEKMLGGSYNRVTGITIVGSHGQEDTKLILRVPRYAWLAAPEREVAILRYVRQYTTIPVPEILAVDLTSNNPLKSPYVVQKRIPGISINAAGREKELTTKQWCAVAREVGRTLLALQKITNPTPGLVEALSNEDGSYSFSVCPFDLIARYDSEWKKKAASVTADEKALVLRNYEHTTLWFLVTQFGRWMADELLRRPRGILGWDFMPRLAEAAAQMDKSNCLGDNTNCLTHLDLAGRNIMARFGEDEAITFTGILDWDSAMFVPKFVACAPPWWLWQDEDDTIDYQEDETKASERPTRLHNQEIKQAFEEIVGEEFLSYAYQPQFRMARKLFHIAIHGNNSSTQLESIQSFLDEWAAFYEAHLNDYKSDGASQDNEDASEGDGRSESQIFRECEDS